jgi:hypothetical protein
MGKPLNDVLPRNTVQYWLPGDERERFENNWKNTRTRRILTENGWTPDVHIEYALNERGLRSRSPIEIDKTILTLGCSFTFGTGLREKDTWSYKVGQLLGKPVYNAGVPGSSCDTAFRILVDLIEEEPFAVFCMAPSEDRWEFIHDGEFKNFGPWGEWLYNDDTKLVTELHINEQRNKLNQYKNLLAMKELCSLYCIPFVHMDRDSSPAFVDGDWARDLGHQGPIWHDQVANEMTELFDKINENFPRSI